MQSMRTTLTIQPLYCYYFLITLLISLAIAEQSPIEYSDDDIIKRAASSHSHNIMRFGRAGHNIMHFGKRSRDEIASAESTPGFESDYTETMDKSLNDDRPINVGQRSLKTRFFIPHAFIASLYTHPRPFLKKAGESRDNLFMHFG